MSLLLLPIVIPLLLGTILLVLPKKCFFDSKTKTLSRKKVCIYSVCSVAITAVSVLMAILLTSQKDAPEILFYLARKMPLQFHFDNLGKIFAAIISIVWLLAGIFSCEYTKHEDQEHEKRYYGFYLLVYATLNGLCLAGNLVTFYLFYELMTISSMPLVLHEQGKEALLAGLKYMFYSFFGAYMVLFGLFVLTRFGLSNTLTFGAGGILDMSIVQGHETLLYVAAFLMILGFGVKAGMFPMHAWLTSAHPVAPAPVSAVLSGIVVKAGVLGIIRVVYYLFGTSFLRGSWVQYTWLVLTLITVLMGSMMAYLEKGFKKRLAYSTVSQVSYILFGLALMNTQAFTGAVLHAVFHAFIKTGLFLTAGAIIYKTGKKQVSEYRGIGKQMPVVIWCYTFVSLALIGIPPASGFISKWYLAAGSLDSGIRVFAYLGPVVLLISALLTAGYLLPVTIHGFLPGSDYDYENMEKKEPNLLMTIPLIVLAVLAMVLGMFPTGLVHTIENIAASIMP